MICDLCARAAASLARVVVRPDVPVAWDESGDGYRVARVCGTCRAALDNPLGLATIAGRSWSLAGLSMSAR